MTVRAALKLRLTSVLWLCASGLAVTALNAVGQVTATAPKSPDVTAQPPAFEVASIKPNKSGSGSSHSGFDDDRFTATNIQLKTLMQYDAYGIPGPQIMGAPNWLTSERFDIEARIDESTVDQLAKLSREQRNLLKQQMVQQLLADRFKLTVHWETKELPVYTLVVARGGPRLTASKNTDGSAGTSSNNGRLTATSLTMEKLAQTLTQILARDLGRVVIDKTGIEGKYDLALTWSPDDHSAAMSNTSKDASDSSGPSIFTALPEQLGLKLESTKAPVQTLVIDHIEQPSEN